MVGSSEERWWRRYCRLAADLDDEVEEGEYVPGQPHSPSDTEEYYNHYSSDSEETVSNVSPYSAAAANNNNGGASSSSAAAANNSGNANSFSTAAANDNGNGSSSSAAAANKACRLCGKEFGSNKAVCGHMKVHVHDRPQGRHEQGNCKGKEVKRKVALAGSWGVTGKRGCSGSGCRDASRNAEPDNSMAIVVAEPKLVLQPMPLAFAKTNLSSVSMASAGTQISSEGSSAQRIRNDTMAIVVHQQATPPPPPPPPAAAGEQAPLVHQQPSAPPPPPPAGEQILLVHQQPAVPPPPPPPAWEQAPLVHHQQPAAPPATGGQNPNGYTCGECNMWFRTHQGLGGHVAGHRNREIAAAAAGMPQDGAVPCRRGPKPEKVHRCDDCGAVFATGVQLGGHKRKHYKGPPIVPKKKIIVQPLPPPAVVAAPQLNPADITAARLTLALPVKTDVQSLAPAVEAAQPAPAPAPAAEGTPEAAPGLPVTGRVLLFGIDIGPGVQTPKAQEGSPAAEDSASIGGQQQ